MADLSVCADVRWRGCFVPVGAIMIDNAKRFFSWTLFLPRQPMLLLESLWAGLIAYFSNRKNPMLMICAWCKVPLNLKPQAKEISHGACWRCYYKVQGGQWIKVPRLIDLEIVKAIRQPKSVVIDEYWTRTTIHAGLVQNGVIIEKAKRRFGADASLTKDERCVIDCVRTAARDLGYEETEINRDEWEGQMKVVNS